jgi:hypothetical protein
MYSENWIFLCKVWGSHSGGYEEHYLLGVTQLETRFNAGILLGLFDHKDGGAMFLRNVGWISTDYMVLYPTR